MLIADLHIHSKYSRATSRDCVPEALELWARRKGINVVGTGDFTHPAWREELREKLIPAEDGLYRLKDELRLPDAPDGAAHTPRFLVTGEISSIYKKRRQGAQGAQCDPPPLSGGRGKAGPAPGRNRQPALRRPADPGARQPRFIRNHDGCLCTGCFYSRAYLDAAFFDVWRILRL